MSQQKLGNFLREVSGWGWDEFIRAENNNSYTSNEAIIFALIRSCVMEKMDAIKISLNRLDGKLVTPIKIVYPKVFYLFPNAKVDDSHKVGEPTGSSTSTIVEVAEVEEPEVDLPAMGLRQTLSKMADYPRELPQKILELALQAEISVKGQGKMPKEIPKVKSVVAAHLLDMAHHRNLSAIEEVFDQLDGKLAETLQIIGSDIYITDYSLEAPSGAYVNKSGILQLEAPQVQDMWTQKLKLKE